MAKAAPRIPASPLAELLAERVADLAKLVRRALKSWDVEAVHHARVTTRRLKAAVDVLRPLLPEAPRSQFARGLRQVRKALGPVRDVDVMLGHVEAMRPPRYDAEAVAWVAGRLHDRRDDLRRRAGRRAGQRKLLERLEAWDDLEPAVRAAEGSAAQLLARAVPEQMRAFAQRADRLARPADPPGDRATEDVHELRIAGKALRYALELAAPLGYRLPKSLGKEFKKLQDALGLWHDYAVLTDEALRLALEAQLGVLRPREHGRVLRLANASWRDADRYLDRFRKRWAGGGEALTAGVLAVFAATADATAPVGATAAEAPPAPTSPAPDVAEGTSEVAVSESS